MPSRHRVAAGWLVGLLVVVLARPTPWSLLVGLPLACIGEALRLWASGHIEKTKLLATGGPYAHSRNPLYVGSLLIALGVAVAAYVLAFYPAVVREEAAFLAAKFEAEYAAWAAAVPLFWPRLAPGGPRSSRFEWARVRMNREWRTALAVPLLAVVLLAVPHLRRALGL